MLAKYLWSNHTNYFPILYKHGCVGWALREHLTPPYCDFTCSGPEDHHSTNEIVNKDPNITFNIILILHSWLNNIPLGGQTNRKYGKVNYITLYKIYITLKT